VVEASPSGSASLRLQWRRIFAVLRLYASDGAEAMRFPEGFSASPTLFTQRALLDLLPLFVTVLHGGSLTAWRWRTKMGGKCLIISMYLEGFRVLVRV
jgi:hypothetical protein